MTYSEYRHGFKTTEEFREAFGKLTEEEAKELITNEPTSDMAKACMITTWRSCREAYLKQEKQ